jgi:hypothetical protein
MRSGFCLECPQVRDGSPAVRGPKHTRCRKADCSCVWHDQDVRDKGTALAAQPVEKPVEKDLAAAVERVALAALEVTTEATGLDALAPEDCLRILYSLRAALEHLRDVEASLVREIYTRGEHGDWQVLGLPVAKVTRSRDRKSWDGRGIARAVIDARIEERNGQIPDDPWDVADWLLEVLGISYGRVTALRALGLDPEMFCESSPGALRVVFSE